MPGLCCLDIGGNPNIGHEIMPNNFMTIRIFYLFFITTNRWPYMSEMAQVLEVIVC